MTVEEMRRHAEQLVERLGVPCMFVDNYDSMSNLVMKDRFAFFMADVAREHGYGESGANVSDQMKDDFTTISIQLPEVTNYKTYAIVLHEMGHALGRNLNDRRAWEWAAQHIKEWNEEVEQTVRDGISTYGVVGENLEQFVGHLKQLYTEARM